MSKPDKATTAKFARTLRELVKQPENRVCADCKKNDPRWASWNLGVFLCIRCSGIHRGMGTHVSKVKSVDLDVWTPEQMLSIQKWGNRLANLYWEAHLKPGHVPPEHKIESFIRSKYESKRWARDGPPPDDPASVLAAGSDSPATLATTTTTTKTDRDPEEPQESTSTKAPAANQGFTRHQLLSSTYTTTTTTQTQTPSLVQSKTPTSNNDLFSLDFHAPATTSTPTPPPPKKDPKQDILSLFSSPPTAAASAWQSPFPQQQQQQQQATSAGTWGLPSSGWQAQQQQQQASIWGMGNNPGLGLGTAAGGGLVDDASSVVWGSSVSALPASSSAATFGFGAGLGAQGRNNNKDDDAFGDIWGVSSGGVRK